MRALFVVHLAKWCLIASLVVIAVSGCDPKGTRPGPVEVTAVETAAVVIR